MPLRDGEIIRYRARRHLLVLLVPLLAVVITAVLALVGVCPVAVSEAADYRCPELIAVAGVIAAEPFVFEWLTTEFILTDERLVRVQAPVWLRAKSVELDAILVLSLHQSLPGRVFDYGTVMVDTAATDGGRLAIDWVAAPQTWAREIETALRERGE